MARGRPPKSTAKKIGEGVMSRISNSRKSNRKPLLPFSNKLVLNQWMLELFGVRKLEELSDRLCEDGLEGLDENNVYKFHHALTSQLFNLTYLSTDVLLQYDQNIYRHSQKLNERRIRRGDQPLVWKHFQYLALLFTEIYLDWYFTRPDLLRREINNQIDKYNKENLKSDPIEKLDESVESWTQLNKISFWMATGSGKTLLMQMNILQYQFYHERLGGRKDLNRIIVLTPNEGLSRQHLCEFEKSEMDAEIFDKNSKLGLFRNRPVEILEVTKLAKESGDKTVAIETFESNNLVLVDEGHRGASSGGEGAWMSARNSLCEKGFSFEYSATFQQAVAGDTELIKQYSRNILFNYSYKFFYSDGYGKDYQILNLDETTQREHLDLYLVACLLTFYQQQKLFMDIESKFKKFQIEKPLLVFVGGTVTKSLSNSDASDIVEILSFIRRYVSDKAKSVQRIDRVLNHGLISSDGQNLFANRFGYLISIGMTPEQIFNESLSIVFNAPGGGVLYVENLKGASGEIALRIGAENEAFGVINVGDDSKLVKICEESGFEVGELEFSGSLFHEINHKHSTVNILIGSKKFTEGWNSWRVSTMGLMNVGKKEGSQIIQLFGRGVRLKGYRLSLKRSRKLRLPADVERPKHIELLETLGIFGIKADYMAQFREFLKEEGLPESVDRNEILLPVIKSLGNQKLRTIRLKKSIHGVSTEFGDAFRKIGPIPTLSKPPVYIQRNKIVLNWYPKIKAMRSREIGATDSFSNINKAHLTSLHTSFLNIDRIYLELERFKAERGWYNLNITRSAIAELLEDQSWYDLYIPAEELSFDDFNRVELWGEIAAALLKKYVERYYVYCKREWESPHLEYRDLTENDPNMLGTGESPGDPYYRILIDESENEIIDKLNELKTVILKGELKQWEFQNIKAIWFGSHLFQPLLYLEQKVVEISPVALNKGEWTFIKDLKSFHGKAGGFFKDKQLYLLRNLSKGRGVGFFEAGNFHPDFILWLLTGDIQHVIFVDPKGLRNIHHSDPKVQFYQTIKEIEMRLGDPNVKLHSFIVSNTPAIEMDMMRGYSKEMMEEMMILFQEEDKFTYIENMFNKVLEG